MRKDATRYVCMTSTRRATTTHHHVQLSALTWSVSDAYFELVRERARAIFLGLGKPANLLKTRYYRPNQPLRSLSLMDVDGLVVTYLFEAPTIRSSTKMRARAFSSGDTRAEAAASLNVSWSDDVFGGASDEDRENKAPLSLGTDMSTSEQNTGGGGKNNAEASAAAMRTELYTTEIVRAMFGPAVGSVVGDYSCSYQRTSGRLYLSTNSLCYYSNLFGSEAKYIFRLSEIIDISKAAKSSSGICIKNKTGHEHIFRSFNDRDEVYQIIVRLHSGYSGGGVSSTTPPPSSLTNSNVMAVGTTPERAAAIAAFAATTTSDADIIQSDSIIEASALRNGHKLDRRFKSFSSFGEASASVKWPKTRRSKRGGAGGKKQHKRIRSKSVDSADVRVKLDTIESSASEVSSSEDELQPEDEVAETTPKDPAYHWASLTEAQLKETAIDGLHLSCNLDEFYDKFLAENAPFSFGDFQTSKIGDFDLELGKWESDGQENGEKRIIKFRHPLKHKLGPSSAAMEKHQFCLRVREHGILLKGCTDGKGFPAADAFHVEDMWIIEPCDSGGVTMTVRFQVQFSKGTMLKKLIDANTKQEYAAMYTKYMQMVASALGEKVKAVETAAEEEVITKAAAAERPAPTFSPFLLYLIIIIMSIVVVVLMYQTSLLRSRVLTLEGQMEEIRQALVQVQAAP